MQLSERQETIKKCLTEFQEIYPHLEVPPITWNHRMRTTAGRVYSKRRLRKVYSLELNPNVLTDTQRLYKTLMHELAHVAEIQLFGNGGHGSTWRHCMFKLGQEAERCHTYDVEHLKRKRKTVKAKCGCKTHDLGITRAKRIMSGERGYKCRLCNVSLTIV